MLFRNAPHAVYVQLLSNTFLPITKTRIIMLLNRTVRRRAPLFESASQDVTEAPKFHRFLQRPSMTSHTSASCECLDVRGWGGGGGQDATRHNVT